MCSPIHGQTRFNIDRAGHRFLDALYTPPLNSYLRLRILFLPPSHLPHPRLLAILNHACKHCSPRFSSNPILTQPEQLIIVTGTPCSGKTFRAQQILQEFEGRIAESTVDLKRSVIHLTSQHATLDPSLRNGESFQPPNQNTNPRDIIYNSAREEKNARAEEFSAIKRALSKNVVVIADAPNYIKGFRYQLFCEAKAAGTRSVVLHTAAREDESVAWNKTRLDAWNWPVEADQDLIQHVNVTQPVGPKIGSNVLGELDPESHTAIYGDKIVNEDTRSQSSSTGAAVSDDEGNESLTRRRKADDTMTLKSLYITDKPDKLSTIPSEPLQNIQEHPQSTQTYPLPSSDPPTPQSSIPYSPSTLRSLHMRYEPPSPFTRWDTPLFTIPSTDPHPPYDQIWSALFPTSTQSTSKKALAKQQQQQLADQKTSQEQPTPEPVRQNAATILPQSTPQNALQTLETTTNDLTKLLLSAARSNALSNGEGGTLILSFPVPDSNPPEIELTIELPEGLVLSQPVLQRLRRKFTQIQRGGIAHGQGYRLGRRGVAEGFVRFLEAEWEGV